MSARIKTYREFWPYYLEQHSHPWTRYLHLLGTVAGVVLGVSLAMKFGWPYLFFGFVATYGLAWTSHFLIEKNRPATFTYPVWSFVSDLRMLLCFVTGRLR